MFSVMLLSRVAVGAFNADNLLYALDCYVASEIYIRRLMKLNYWHIHRTMKLVHHTTLRHLCNSDLLVLSWSSSALTSPRTQISTTSGCPCCSSPLPHPVSSNVNTAHPPQLTLFNVGAKPINCPLWIPLKRSLQNTLLCSATISSIWT